MAVKSRSRRVGVATPAALVAAVDGYLQLALLLFDIPLLISNAAVFFYIAARVVLGLWAVLLGVEPLASLRMVEGHRDLIARRSRTVVAVLAVAGWLVTMRNNLSFLGFPTGTLARVGSASAHFGSVSLSVGELTLGIGIGFGLQTIVNNLSSGFPQRELRIVESKPS